MARKLISARETRARLGGISPMTEWRWRRDGILPPKIQINGRNFDDEAVIDEMIERLAAAGGDQNQAA